MRISIQALVALTGFFLAACTKHDFCKQRPNETSCHLVEVVESSTSKENTFTRSLFRAQFDSQTGKAVKVMLRLFRQLPEDSVVLVLKYNGNRVHLLRESNHADTIQTAVFNDSNRLVEIQHGNAPHRSLYPVFVGYDSGRLSNIHIDSGSPGGFDFGPEYDAYGNVAAIFDATHGTFNFYYTYNLDVRQRSNIILTTCSTYTNTTLCLPII